MERNKLLRLASTVCSVFSALQIAGIVIATIVLVHWHFDKDFYREVKINSSGNVHVSSKISEKEVRPGGRIWIEKSEQPEKRQLTLAELTPVSVYIFYVQAVISLLFIYFIFREFGKVVHSVNAYQAFRTDNIEAFRRIGKYLFVIFIVSGFSFISSDPASAHVSMDFNFTPLILMLVAYVLAEIFKEGNRLYEEEQLTV